MKRYLFGILAVALAFAAVAFKAPDKKATTNLYRFSGDVTDINHVQNPARWNFIAGGSGAQDCPANIDEVACEIMADVSPSSGTLPTTGYSITATRLGGVGTPYRVSAVPTGSEYYNKLDD